MIDLAGRPVDAVIECSPWTGRWTLRVGPMRLSPEEAAALDLRMRDATADEWAALAACGYGSLVPTGRGRPIHAA